MFNVRPQWSADGRLLAFQSDREGGVQQIFVVAADGSGSPRRTVTSSTGLSLTTWSASGVFGGVTRGDIWTAREGEAARPFFSSPEFELYPTFSPDGKWIAYSAVKNNRSEVFVRPYPGPEPAVQVSGAGGEAPAWSSDGRLLYFLNTTSPPSMMRVAVTTTGDITVGQPATVFAKWQYRLGTPSRSYDVLRDGSFFGVTTTGGGSQASYRSRNKVQEFHVVLNFLTELRERVR